MYETLISKARDRVWEWRGSWEMDGWEEWEGMGKGLRRGRGLGEEKWGTEQSIHISIANNIFFSSTTVLRFFYPDPDSRIVVGRDGFVVCSVPLHPVPLF